jgi:7-cyano-7-deazaguanine synthase
MCAIIGALVWNANLTNLREANRIMNHIGRQSINRGRDGWGYHTWSDFRSRSKESSIARWDAWDEYNERKFFDPITTASDACMIGNFRAEPTTEFVAAKQKSDQQPYRCGKWTIVHNGTIANDKDLRTYEYETKIDSAAIVELLNKNNDIFTRKDLYAHFLDCVQKLKGSYAILAVYDKFPNIILAACNYRPIWFAEKSSVFYFASSRSYFTKELIPLMVPAYSCWAFESGTKRRLDTKLPLKSKALVVCSGGMDSVIAAASARSKGYDVSLVHFRYGSRAGGPELKAVKAVAEAMKMELYIKTIPVYDTSDSPLLQHDSLIAGGEAGAEFAYEWVPARNLVMLSMATALAEAKGFDTIVLGNNMEEAGAYPDNEPEFIERFNDMLPFAVGDGKQVRIEMPVGNLMKHEIVALGHELGVPLHLTWSCYRAGPIHCGKCGPCFMRRTAFEINKLPEVIPYAN